MYLIGFDIIVIDLVEVYEVDHEYLLQVANINDLFYLGKFNFPMS